MRRHSLAISCAHQVALFNGSVVGFLTLSMFHHSDSSNSAPKSTGLRYTRYHHWPQTPRLSGLALLGFITFLPVGGTLREVVGCLGTSDQVLDKGYSDAR